jgi:hypothetical protein
MGTGVSLVTVAAILVCIFAGIFVILAARFADRDRRLW